MNNKRTSDSKHGSGTTAAVRKERERSRSPRRSHTTTTHDEDHDTTDAEQRKQPLDNIALDAKKRLKTIGIQMKLGAQKPQTKPKLTIASAFNQDSDDEPEEMPPEARMRMRNIGRDTPTSSGPNSFGKTKHGFSDAKKVFERNLKEAMDSATTADK